MKAVVLAGGEGTRLAPYTRVLPKPLLPIGDRPILEIIVGQLRDAGADEIVIATGHLSGLIETYFGDGSAFGVPISYARESAPLGTAGPLATIDGLGDTFLMMNGDILATPFFDELLAAHRESGAVATIATRPEEVEIDFGVVHLDGDAGGLRRIESIEEKPVHVCQVSAGVYAFEPEVVSHIEPGVRLDFPDLLQTLIDSGELVTSYEHTGYWLDVGQRHHLETAIRDFEAGAEEFLGARRRSPLERSRPISALRRAIGIGRRS